MQDKLASGQLTDLENRALGVMLGMAIGDSLGAPLEFSDVRYGATEVTDLEGDQWEKEEYNRFQLKPGQWTDDTSMGLCLADSLLVNKGRNDGILTRARAVRRVIPEGGLREVFMLIFLAPICFAFANPQGFLDRTCVCASSAGGATGTAMRSVLTRYCTNRCLLPVIHVAVDHFRYLTRASSHPRGRSAAVANTAAPVSAWAATSRCPSWSSSTASTRARRRETRTHRCERMWR